VEGPTDLAPGSSSERLAARAARIALVERDRAWKLASNGIGCAVGGHGSVLVFAGAGGLGKSGLVFAVRGLAEQSGLTVLSATGRQHERSYPFGVVLQLFGEETPRPPAAERNGPASWFDAIHDTYALCATRAEARPLVVAVDDADRADEASLRFLLYLSERVSELPVFVVVTTGSVPARTVPPTLSAIARGQGTTTCVLEPLTPLGTVRRLAKAMPAAVADETAMEIHEESGGNPYIVDTLARALGTADASDQLAPGETMRGGASRALADWVLFRAAEFGARAPSLLNAIAVLGPRCEVRHACELAGVGVEEAHELLDALVEVGILAPGDSLSFAQPAVATAVNTSLTHGQRSVANLRAARMLADEGEPPDRIAEHLMEAPRAGSAATVEALSMAAAVSLGRANPFDAVRYLTRALEEPPPRGLRPDVVLDLGRAEAMAGEPQAASHLAAGIGNGTHAPQTPKQALTTGRALFALGRPDEALAVLDGGLEQLNGPDNDTSERLRAAREAVLWLTRGRTHSIVASTVPPATADTPGERALLALHAIDSTVRGRPVAEGRELAERALARGALLDDETSDGMTYYLAALAVAFSGDLALAEAALAAALEDARSRGSVLGFATASHARALTILKRGRLRDAETEARHALAVERDGWRQGLGGARAVLASVSIERGDLDAAAAHIRAAELTTQAWDPFKPSLVSADGRRLLFSGDAEAALERFLECGRLADAVGIVNPAVVAWKADAGLATCVIGDWDEGRRLIESEIALARDFGEPSAVGRALRSLGVVLDPSAGIDAFQAAADELGKSQAALDRAAALVDYGAALRRSGRRRDARAPLREGLELAESCGADMLAKKARREAAAAGARPRRSALHGVGSLTAREHQVASLAAEGLSNREIGEQLVVTVKTVEWHMNHVFMKLGVRSRTELAEKLPEIAS
jgi:DNA-binding CsgD family transcriptional regulator